MIVVFVVVAALLVVVIALVAVGGVTGRLGATAPTSVYDLDEAVEFVADRLPEDITSQLSFDDVRALLLWHLDYLEERGIARDFGDHTTSGPLLVGDDEGVAYVLGKAQDAGMELDDVWVVQVLDGQAAYLEAIGAIGEQLTDE